MAQEKMFQEALNAIDQGQREKARDLFTRLLRTDQSNVEYWLWMSTLVETQAERVYCLESALRADPQNEAARRGLILLGAQPAPPDTAPAAPVRRRWAADLEKELEPPKTFVQRVWDNPITRLATLVGGLVLVVGLIWLGIYGTRLVRQQIAAGAPTMIRVSPFPTRTPENTLTPTVTSTRLVRSMTPTMPGPTPLWMFLTETYTPVPLYVNTPHPVVEAYTIAMRSYSRGDYAAMETYLSQAIRDDPSQPDFYYYLGESQRLQGEYETAIASYEQAIAMQNNFAPAYLGRARARLGISPNADISADLQKAIDYDPFMVDAYLERASYYLNHNEIELALEELTYADNLFPGSPKVASLLAEAYLSSENPEAALEYAQLAYELDQTDLSVYLTLAKAYTANLMPAEARYYAQFFLRYEPQDPTAWFIVGLSYFIEEEDYDSAIRAFSRAIDNSQDFVEGYRYRGLTYLAMGDTEAAVDDLTTAITYNYRNFDISIELSQAYWADGRLDAAYKQFVNAGSVSETDEQRAISYYWRAQVAEELGKPGDARADWNLLLALPEEAVPAEMRAEAEEHLRILQLTLNPATRTPTSTFTRRPTASATPTRTPRPSATPTPTPTITLAP